MSTFRTVLQPPPAPFALAHSDSLLCMGSCFAENIGQRLAEHHFKTVNNPFGIIYNPISIAQNLTQLLDNQPFTKESLFFHNHLWHSFDHHSRFSHPDPDTCLENINRAFNAAHQQLQRLDVLFLTFGTANTFRHLSKNRIVANCHKLPAHHFIRQRLTIETIIDHYRPLLKRLQTLRPDLRIVLTVSPIRHLKDGFLENQRSKATLLLAAEALTQPSEAFYFPAYEWILDDLRDYRFFEPDMVHPNSQALEYVWQRFEEVFFTASTCELNQQIRKIRQAAQHRPFYPQSPDYQSFINKTIQTIENLEHRYPFLDFKKEKEKLTQNKQSD